MRSQYVGKGAIHSNTFAQPAATKFAMTIRAPEYGGSPTYAPGTTTNSVVISDNKFIGSDESTLLAALEPKNETSDQRTNNTIVERNWFVAGSATTSGLTMRNVTNATVRNNIFNMTDGGGTISFVSNGNYTGTPATDSLWIYNNSWYRANSGVITSFRGLNIPAGSASTNVVARNNLAYGPGSSGTVYVMPSGISGLTASNNSSDGQLTGTDPFDAAPSGLSNWTPNGYAVGGGTDVPVWSDFFMSAEPVTRDIGAAVN